MENRRDSNQAGQVGSRVEGSIVLIGRREECDTSFFFSEQTLTSVLMCTIDPSLDANQFAFLSISVLIIHVPTNKKYIDSLSILMVIRTNGVKVHL